MSRVAIDQEVPHREPYRVEEAVIWLSLSHSQPHEPPRRRYLDGLVRGTMGDLPEDWTWSRPQPILVRLNVAQLVEDELHHPGLMGLDEAIESLGRRYESANGEQDLDAWDGEIDSVTDRYVSEYRRYAERFADAARIVAGDIPGLSADVHVAADTDPNSTWWSATATNNPTAAESDPLAVEIWRAAHDRVPLPNVDVWLAASHPTATRE